MKVLSVRVPDFVYDRLKELVGTFAGGGTTIADAARQAIVDGIDSAGSQVESPVKFLTRAHTTLFGDGPALGQQECERFLLMVHNAFLLAAKPRYASASCAMAMGRVAVAILHAAESAGYVMDDAEKRYLLGNIGRYRNDRGAPQESVDLNVERHLKSLPALFPASREEVFSRVPYGVANAVRDAVSTEALTCCIRKEARYLYPAAVLGARLEWKNHKDVDFGALPGSRTFAEKFSAGDERNGQASAAVSMFGDGTVDRRPEACLTLTRETGTLLVSKYPFGVLSLLDEFMGYKKLLEVVHPGLCDGGWVYGAGWQLEFNASMEKEPTLWSGGIVTTVTWDDIEQAKDRLRDVLQSSAFLAKHAEWSVVMGGLV